jgi:hypothetical protein
MSNKHQSESDSRLFELLAQEREEAEQDGAPSSLKAKLYSALVRKQEASGPLRTLAETRTRGYGLCVFEDLWERITSAEAAQSFNCCSVCHARGLAERLETPPIYWANCPYVALGKK